MNNQRVETPWHAKSKLPARTNSLVHLKPLAVNTLYTVMALFVLLSALACSTDKGVRQSLAGEELRSNPSVIVVGAGLAGLNSALLLEQQGYTVTILEAQQRIGGRLFTLDEIPGKPEAGGNIIGPSYARIIDRAQQLGVPLLPAPQIAGGQQNLKYHVSGEFIAQEDWASASQNEFPHRMKRVPPGGALFAMLRQNPLETPADWLSQKSTPHDVPILSVFQKFGFNEKSQLLANHTNSYGNSLADTSLLAMYRIAAVYAAGRALPGYPMAIEGGNQRLPEAMAAAVTGDLLLGKWVTAIKQNDGSVTVQCKDGSTYRADYVLLTAPLPALRDIDVQPALPALQRKAVNELDYAKTFLAFFTVSGKYWGEHTPSVWTDTRAERLFATADSEGSVSNITMWTTGQEALELGALGPAEQEKALYQAMFDIYPEAKGKVTLRAVQDWSNDPLTGGSWLRWQPGQISEFGAALAQPAGRLFFAGEHTAIANTGMEGAMESAERAVGEIMEHRVNGEFSNGEAYFVHCQGCHSRKQGESHKLGPNLYAFFGKPMASQEGYNYSKPLSSAGGRWNRETLRSWLKDPQGVVPGNRMIYTNLLGEDELDSLLSYLQTLH